VLLYYGVSTLRSLPDNFSLTSKQAYVLCRRRTGRQSECAKHISHGLPPRRCRPFPCCRNRSSKPAGHSWDRGILIALINMSNLMVAPCFVVLQFVAQFWEMRAQNGNPGALSLLSIGLQVLTSAALGYRWFLRIGNPTWGNLPASAWLWYQWSFPAINYVAHAVGCAFLLACYVFAARRTAEHGDSEDRMPLLG
jgi:hypothetical protein